MRRASFLPRLLMLEILDVAVLQCRPLRSELRKHARLSGDADVFVVFSDFDFLACGSS